MKELAIEITGDDYTKLQIVKQCNNIVTIAIFEKDDEETTKIITLNQSEFLEYIRNALRVMETKVEGSKYD